MAGPSDTARTCERSPDFVRGIIVDGKFVPGRAHQPNAITRQWGLWRGTTVTVPLRVRGEFDHGQRGDAHIPSVSTTMMQVSSGRDDTQERDARVGLQSEVTLYASRVVDSTLGVVDKGDDCLTIGVPRVPPSVDK